MKIHQKDDYPDSSEVVVSSEQLYSRIQEVAEEIVETYSGDYPLFVCILRGGAPFALSLMRTIRSIRHSGHPQLEFMRIHTPGINRAEEPSALIQDVGQTAIPNSGITLLDGLLDTGLTVSRARNHLAESVGITDVNLITVIEKAGNNRYFDSERTACFTLPGDGYYAGFGLDSDGLDAYRFDDQIIRIKK